MAGRRAGREDSLNGLAQDIRELVLTGAIQPGDKLEEQALAARFSVSRTPIREALRQLASTGLIELRPNRGAYVATLTPDQLDDIFVAMVELEATCARLAAMSMLPAERRNLQRLHESMAQLAERELIDQYELANEELHSMICQGAHNPVLAEMTEQLRNRRRPYRNTQFRSPGRLIHSQDEHEAVVRAIISGDPARAHASMLHHLGQASASFEQARQNALP
jgi:DNA-binding GntR family transcriptional regulator